MGAKFYEHVSVVTATTGTGPITLGAAVGSLWQTFTQAGVGNGELVEGFIQDLGTSQRERGQYTATVSGGVWTLARTTFMWSDTGSELALSGNATFTIVPSAADLNNLVAASQSSVVRQQFTGDGATTSFTVTNGYTANTLLVFINGVKQTPTDVTQSTGTNVVFAVAPASGSTIDVYGYVGVVAQAYLPLDGSGQMTGPLKMSDGTQLSTAQSLGMRNRLINGDMMIDQRYAGASASIGLNTGFYVVDRWYCQTPASSGTASVQQVAINWSGCRATKALQYTVTATDAAPTGGDLGCVLQVIEGNNIKDLGWGTSAAQTAVISFWVQAAVAGNYFLSLYNSAGTYSFVHAFTVAAANTPQKFTVTVPGPTAGVWATDSGMGVLVRFGLCVGPTRQTATADAWVAGNYAGQSGGAALFGAVNNTFLLTDVQFEVGTVATPFERRHIGIETSLCQRYYCQSYTGRSVGSTNGPCMVINRPIWTNVGFCTVNFPVSMRATPTVTLYNNSTSTAGSIHLSASSVDVSATAGAITTAGFNSVNAPGNNLNAGDFSIIPWDASAEF